MSRSASLYDDVTGQAGSRRRRVCRALRGRATGARIVRHRPSLEVVDGEVAVESIWRVAEHPSDPIAVNTVVAIDSRRVLEFAADAGGFVEVGSTTIAPGIGLPPTKVYLLD